MSTFWFLFHLKCGDFSFSTVVFQSIWLITEKFELLLKSKMMTFGEMRTLLAAWEVPTLCWGQVKEGRYTGGATGSWMGTR